MHQWSSNPQTGSPGQKRGWCIIVYVHNSLSAIRRTDLESRHHENIVLELKFLNKKLLYCTWYRPEHNNIEEANLFIQSFSDLAIASIDNQFDTFVCVGDFNDRCIEWDDGHANSRLCDTFVHTVHDMNLLQLINAPTRITDDTAYLLDLLITDAPAHFNNIKVCPPICNSDHCVIFAEYNWMNA
jgi:hypothetical protein